MTRRLVLVGMLLVLGSACRVRKREPAPETDPTAAEPSAAEATSAAAALPPAVEVAPPAPPPEPVEAPKGVLAIVIGGAGSHPRQSATTLQAVDEAVRKLVEGGDPMDAAAAAIVLLEDHPAFNAGTGSVVPVGSAHVNMDAAIADSSGRFGAVAGLRRVKNPVLLARRVADTPQTLVSGAGAEDLAVRWGLELGELVTAHRLAQRDQERARILGAEPRDGEFDWRALLGSEPVPTATGNDPKDDPDGVSAGAADEAPSSPAGGPDAPAAATPLALVRTAGGAFAVAASTGGPILALDGRTTEVPIFGAALFVGADGAVAVTGTGERIARAGLARKIYARLQRSHSPQLAARWGSEQIQGAGVVVLTAGASAMAFDGPIAWAKREADEVATGMPKEPMADKPPQPPPSAEPPPPGPQPTPPPARDAGAPPP